MFVLFAITTFILIFAAAYGMLKAVDEIFDSTIPLANLLAGAVLFIIVAAIWIISGADIVTISR